MKLVRLLVPAMAGVLSVFSARAVSLDDITFWAGSGTNRAALVIEWRAPEVRNQTTVNNPAATESLVWGYRWNGTATGQDLLNAIVAADPHLFVGEAAPSQFGTFIYAFGYDLNQNGVFGLRGVTNNVPENAFTNGQYIFNAEDPDGVQSLDAGDLFWSGSSGPYWELWQEAGGAGGFTNMPDRGADPYWTPADPTMPWYGSHGQWDLASSSAGGITLHDGSWLGYTISAGGLNYLDDTDPGTIAYDFHKHAPATPENASTNSVYLVQVTAAQGPFGSAPYDDPAATLGAPATRYYESASKPATRVKLIEAAYNVSITPGQTNKLIITLNTGSAIIARFDHPVTDDPAHPYGIDFEVFGNTFYSANGFGDAANLNTVTMGGGSFAEPMKVSVSPGYTGQPGEDAADPTTWPWYRYDGGPYADSDFPTQAYRWDRATAQWTDELLDFTKPVNPAVQARISAGGLAAADGIDLYAGSGGGTSFDLKESGFAAVQYVKIEGLTGNAGGEVDACSAVRSMTVGDALTIAPANLTNNTAELFFQKPGAESQTVAALNFTAVSDFALVATAPLNNPEELTGVSGNVLNAVQLAVTPVLGSDPVTFVADLHLAAGAVYAGNGSDLDLLQRSGTNWDSQSFTYNASTGQAVASGVTNLSAFVLTQVVAPALDLQANANGAAFALTPVPHWTHELERSTNLVDWVVVDSVTPTNNAPVNLHDPAAPADRAFYRLHLTKP